MKSERYLTILFVVLLMIFSIHTVYQNSDGLRADLTEDGLYTLTEGTHQILDKMTKEGVQPINVKLYFSETAGKSLPAFIKNFITYENYVRNLLQEYARYSNGKITVEAIDPKTDSDEAQDAADYGLDGKMLNQHGDLFYFGVVFQTQTGSKDVIDFLWPEKQETLEYEISKRIYGLLWPAKKRVGVISSLDVIADDNPYYAQLMAAQGKQAAETWTMFKIMKDTHEVSKIDLDTQDKISHEDYDVVVVVHPRSLGDKQLWALDEWIVTGGNTMVLLDPYALRDQAPQNPQQPFAQYQYKPSSNLARLMEKWGIRRLEDQVAVDFELAVKRPVSRSGPAENVIVDLAINDKTRAATLNGDVPMFQGLNNLRFFMPGVLELVEPIGDDEQPSSNLEYVPLVTTTESGDRVNLKAGFPSGNELTFLDAFNSPGKLIDHYSPKGKQTLAYLIRGAVPSAFPDGARFPAQAPETPPGMPPGFQMPPPEDAEWIEKEPVSSDLHKPASVIVFADVDFISDDLAFQQSIFGLTAANDNHKVMLNSIDYLLGSEELLNVRSKSSIRRPFIVFDEVEARADEETLGEERKFRAEVERFQKELSEKQGQLSQKNAHLLEKKFQDELDDLQEKKSTAERQLREIRKQKRAAIEDMELGVKFATMWATPIMVLILGVALYIRRRLRQYQARRGDS